MNSTHWIQYSKQDGFVKTEMLDESFIVNDGPFRILQQKIKNNIEMPELSIPFGSLNPFLDDFNFSEMDSPYDDTGLETNPATSHAMPLLPARIDRTVTEESIPDGPVRSDSLPNFNDYAIDN